MQVTSFRTSEVVAHPGAKSQEMAASQGKGNIVVLTRASLVHCSSLIMRELFHTKIGNFGWALSERALPSSPDPPFMWRGSISQSNSFYQLFASLTP